MYSRNQSRGFNDEEYEDEEQSEEYELYAYNLPPNYDGSRFRRRTNYKPKPHIAEATRVKAEIHSNDKSEANENDSVHEVPHIVRILESFGKMPGNEDLLIIALILILAGEGCSSDTLLLLTLLLLLS